MGGSRRYLAVVAATLSLAAQTLAAGGALAATPTTTRILYAPASPVAGTAYQFTAQIKPYATDRTVDWFVDGGLTTTDLTNPNGISQVWLTFDAGVHDITAFLEAGATWDGSESDPYSLTVTASSPGPISLSIQSDPNPVLRGDVTTVTVGFEPAADSGSVVLREVGTGTGTLVNLDHSNSVEIPWWSRTSGTFQLEACFLGSDKFLPACSPILMQVVVSFATTTTLMVSPNPDYPDVPLTFDITVDPAPEVPVTVVVNDTTPPAGGGRWNVPVGTDGVGQLVLSGSAVQSSFSVGHHPLVAFYPGTLHTDSSLSPAVDLLIHQDPSSTSLTASPAVIVPGDPLTLSVDVSPGPPPGTSVGVWISGPIGFGDLATVVLDAIGHGSTTWSSTGLLPDVYTFRAEYAGEAEIAPSNDEKQVTVVAADTQAPSGSITIAGGAAWTKTTAVALSVPATDAGSGVALIALSNDGTNWTTRSYATSQVWTLSAVNGPKTIWAKWKDGAGNWSAPKSDSIGLDTIAPILATRAARIGLAGSALVGGAMPWTIGWDVFGGGSPIASYRLSQSIDGAAYTGISNTLTTQSLIRNLLPGHTYVFAVRATDLAGNVSEWTFGPKVDSTAIQQSNAAVHYQGTWTTSLSTTWWGGGGKSSSQAGATASLTFTGRSVAWISLKAANRGKAQVYVNGVLTATVDLYAASLQKQRVAWSATWSASATRTILIKVLATPTRPRIDVDGFVTGT